MNTDTQVEDSLELKKLNLTVEVKSTGACQRHVRVSVAREDIDRYFQKQFDEIAPRAELPGFRPGKAPRKLLESKFRKQVEAQVKGALLMDSLAQVNSERHFSAISEPDLNYEKVEIPETGPMTYEFDIEVRPEFELPQWEGLSIERPEHEFTDEEVIAYARKIAIRQVDLVPVDGPIAKDDEVTFRITGTLDGAPVVSIDEISFAVRSNIVFSDGRLENFDKLAVGKKAGDRFSTPYTVISQGAREDLRGKTLQLEFEVLDVRRPEDIDLQRMATLLGFDDPEVFKKAIRESLEQQLAYEQRRRVREQISQSLTESANWALPPDLLKRQFRRELARFVMELRSSGFSDEQIRQQENLARHELMSRTEVLLKEHFILERIAEEKQIEDEPQDYDFHIARLAASTNESPRRLRARLEKNGQIDALRNMIIEGKVIDMIIQSAKVKPVPYDKANVSDSIEAVDLAITGEEESEIPEAKFDEKPEAPIPGVSNKKG